MDPHALNLRGSTQPEIFRGTVDAMAGLLQADAAKFWQESLARAGPVEIWEMGGERWVYNRNHRYQAAVQAGVEIPDATILIVDRTGSTIPTYPFDQLTWLAGVK